jgi:hypothetical protein
MLVLTCFEESDSWWFLSGFSDNVSHILVGAHHGCCSCAVTRGLDRRILDDVNVWSLPGFGWESFTWVRCLDSRMGAYLWDLSLGHHTGDGQGMISTLIS